jgi:hypothetical protein
MSAFGYTIKRASRAGFYRIAYALPVAGNRLNGAWVEKVVDSATAVRFAQRHGIALPEAA